MIKSTIFPLMVAIMAGNFLSIMFIYGLYRARRIYDGDRLDFETAAAILVPLFFLCAGFYIYR